MQRTQKIIDIVTFAAVVGVLTYVFAPKIPKALFPDTAVFKLNYQFLLLVVLGGALSLLYKRLETEREEATQKKESATSQRERERNLQAEFRTSVIRAYQNAKRVRRLLRAKASEEIQQPKTTIIHAEAYNEQMECLIDVQLDFELCLHRVTSSPELSNSKPHLEKHLTDGEEYLHSIIDEYGKSRSLFTQHQGKVPLSNLQRLADFIRPFTKASGFASKLVLPFHSVLKELDALIAKP